MLAHLAREVLEHAAQCRQGDDDGAERAELAAFWFDHLAAGRIKVEIGQRYRLEDCVQAHRDLEAGKTIGSSVFVL